LVFLIVSDAEFLERKTIMSRILQKTLVVAGIVSLFLLWPSSPTQAARKITCMNIPASPSYLTTRREADAVAAINAARARERLPALRLPANYYSLSPTQKQLVLLNLERQDRGLPELRPNDSLTRLALRYSERMQRDRTISHELGGSFQKRARRAGMLKGSTGENLAGNPVGGAGPIYEYMYQDLHEGCSHRTNILNPAYKIVGIGLVPDRQYGTISAQEFVG
jgi:uncharacterized protein YkwD